MKTYGFNLVELMVVVSVLTIMTIVAYPTYTSYMTKTRRTNVKGFLVLDAAFLEQFYTLNGCYNNVGADLICGTSDDTLPTLPYYCSPSSSVYNAKSKPPCDSTGYYSIKVDTSPSCPFPCPSSSSCAASTYASGTAYLLTATPQGSQTSDGVLTIQSDNGQGWANNPSKNACSWQ